MKTLLKFTLFFAGIAFLSCSKDDANQEKKFAELTGNWEVTSYSYQGNTEFRSINSNETWSTSYVGDGWLMNFNFVFSENPNTYAINGQHRIDHYFTDRNGNEYYYSTELNRDEVGTFTRNNNTSLTFNVNELFKEGFIVDLNDTTLKFNITFSSSETDDDNILEHKHKK